MWNRLLRCSLLSLVSLFPIACADAGPDDAELNQESSELRRRRSGTCGSADGVPTATAPTSNLCATGTASAVSGSGPFTWSCYGRFGGSTASCSAPLASPPPPPPPPPTSTSTTPPPPPPPPTQTAPNASRQCAPVTSGVFEAYHLPPPTGLPTGVSFLSDWTQRPQAGGFSGIQAVDACRMHADGFLTSHGKTAVRVEVNPGDDPLGLGTERAEVLGMQDASGNELSDGGSNTTIYYGTSYYFPTTWDGTFIQGDSDSWSFVNQFYGAGGLAAGRRSATGQQIYWYSGLSGSFSDGGAITLGHWTDFIFEVAYTTGTMTIYRREEGQTTFISVLTGTSASLKSMQYYKQGLYRGPNVNGRTDVLWVGPTSRGSSFAAVEQASFGTNGGH